MKYIAIFDIPDDYCIGCAVAKIAPKGRDVYYDTDFKDEFAQVEPLAEKGVEILDCFNTVNRVLMDLNLHCAYDMPSFWKNNGKDYVVIDTKYHKGYMQALSDMEKEVRLRFGFTEREYVNMPPLSRLREAEGDETDG